jgi:hypothetical protein
MKKSLSKKFWSFGILGGPALRYLTEVATPVLTDVACRARYNIGMINTNIQICSGGGQKGACQVKQNVWFSRQSFILL